MKDVEKFSKRNTIAAVVVMSDTPFGNCCAVDFSTFYVTWNEAILERHKKVYYRKQAHVGMEPN